MDPGSGDPARMDAGHLQALRRESEALARSLKQATARARASRGQVRQGREQRKIWHELALARAQARLESQAVVEQANGIVMAQLRCGPDEASGALRQAAQRANVTVQELAAQIVKEVASGKRRG